MNRTSPPRSAQRVRSSAEIPDPVADELCRYDDHLRDVRGLAAGTRRNHCRIVAQLLRKKLAGGVVNMAKLRAADVRRFIAWALRCRRPVRVRPLPNHHRRVIHGAGRRRSLYTEGDRRGG